MPNEAVPQQPSAQMSTPLHHPCNSQAQLHYERFLPGKLIIWRATCRRYTRGHDMWTLLYLTRNLWPWYYTSYHRDTKTHWTGSHHRDIASFREDLLAYGQIYRLQMQQNKRESYHSGNPDCIPPINTDNIEPGERRPLRFDYRPRVQSYRTDHYPPGYKGGWSENTQTSEADATSLRRP
ncbi:hypothetical protein PR048_009674 [Dryococelus australis]|uniref:Uncharacterized protein n=1 Tax=Dryococelus australis TaxID=614101 RepID=A0ABQ9I0Y7_9NEOP|nr:hypothetical protein PR048_009674 [Dryococelus australis]